MATPSSSQPANNTAGLGAQASVNRLAANSRLTRLSTRRPPWWSMARPLNGPSSAETPSARLKPSHTWVVAMPSSAAMAPASMAGR